MGSGIVKGSRMCEGVEMDLRSCELVEMLVVHRKSILNVIKNCT